MKFTRRNLFRLGAGAAAVPLAAKLPTVPRIVPLAFDPPMTAYEVVMREQAKRRVLERVISDMHIDAQGRITSITLRDR